MSAQGVFPAQVVRQVAPEAENASAGQRAALAWLREAVSAVSEAFPQVNFGTAIDPGIQAAFDDALAARFYGVGEIDDETFKAAWRRWYQAHL